MNLAEVSIMPEPVYRIRHAWRSEGNLWHLKGRMQYKYFVGTRRQCARRIAWWYVWGKYDSYSGSEKVKGLECFCGDSENSSRYPWNDSRFTTTITAILPVSRGVWNHSSTPTSIC